MNIDGTTATLYMYTAKWDNCIITGLKYIKTVYKSITVNALCIGIIRPTL